MQKELFASVFLRGGETVLSFQEDEKTASGEALIERYSGLGADGVLLFDLSSGEKEHEDSLSLMRKMARKADIPLWGCGNIKRVEDVKKILYAGCRKALLNFEKPSGKALLSEVSDRFGKDKIGVTLKAETPLSAEEAEMIERYASVIVILLPEASEEKLREMIAPLSERLPRETQKLFFLEEEGEEAELLSALVSLDEVFSPEAVLGLSVKGPWAEGESFYQKKRSMREAGFIVNTFESAFSWEELKKDQNGLVPVVVTDVRNGEVLMVAYMNEEAYETTFRTGLMTYYSRSRQSLWVKGESSGHFQYLKVMKIDCDMDTLLAKVFQVGAACHTGNRSCFYRTVVEKNVDLRNPMKVFEDVYAVIEDRKMNPKEGSYTNYLFEKGIDKILKKCGEEAAEIIIAAKNPDAEEVKYEIADFLYHVMVLMSEKGVTWEDISMELANRE